MFGLEEFLNKTTWVWVTIILSIPAGYLCYIILGYFEAVERLRGVIALGVVFLIICLAIIFAVEKPDHRNAVIAMLGIIASGAVALSSPTFISNAMAGAMLGANCKFKVGDYISVGEYFGQVLHRRMFFTVIQTEERDLLYIPNSHIASRPLRVINGSGGTLISCTVSLGYDVPSQSVENLLVRAAIAIELENPFVQIMDLGDFSINYKVCGVLRDVSNRVITARSELRKMVVDFLHSEDIEIVSPTFMNQRQITSEDLHVSKSDIPDVPESHGATNPGRVMFPLGFEQNRLEKYVERKEQVEKELTRLENSKNVNSFYKQEEIRKKKKYLAQITKLIERVESELEDQG